MDPEKASRYVGYFTRELVGKAPIGSAIRRGSQLRSMSETAIFQQLSELVYKMMPFRSTHRRSADEKPSFLYPRWSKYGMVRLGGMRIMLRYL